MFAKRRPPSWEIVTARPSTRLMMVIIMASSVASAAD
jgi:hypothetical protein